MMTINSKQITSNALAIALMCVISPLSIKISAIPFTLSLLVVFTISLYFSTINSALICLIYLLLGAIGLPVFSGWSSGVGILVSPTGGYLWSYVILSAFVSYFSKKQKSLIGKFFICILGLVICYIMGTGWYCYVTNNTFLSGILVCVAPFIVFDIIKIIIALIFYNNVLVKL